MFQLQSRHLHRAFHGDHLRKVAKLRRSILPLCQGATSLGIFPLSLPLFFSFCLFSYAGMQFFVYRGVRKLLFRLFLEGGVALWTSWRGACVVGRTVLVSANLLLAAPFVRTRGGGSGGPGIIFVLTSSLNCNSLDYCKRRGFRAPGVSGLTRDKVHFARYCSKAAIDTPSHSYLLANARDKRAPMHNGLRLSPRKRFPLPSSTHAVFRMVGSTKCGASTFNG